MAELAQPFPELHDMEAERQNSSRTMSQRSSAAVSRHGSNTMIKWARVALYTVFTLIGSAVAVVLSRLYFEKGGKSKWVGTLVQIVGFPLLIPFYYYISVSPPNPSPQAASTRPSTVIININPNIPEPPPSLRLLILVYTYLGLLVAANAFLYSFGFQYLPVSTVSLISASQLAFNAFFSYFLNAQKFTPYIVNSLLLLTVSSVLLVANSDTEKPAGVTNGEYAAGFVCTCFAAAINGLCIASQQLVFRRVLKRPTVRVVIELIVYQSLVASILVVVGLLASGGWRGLKEEMEGYEAGKASYATTLLWAAVAYQVFAFGGVALVFEVSALFGNVIGALGTPIAPIVAMFLFHDKMDVVKGMAMLLALWGFTSYLYQNYLDDLNCRARAKAETKVDTSTSTITDQLSEA